MTTSTPPAWHFLEEKYVPVKTDELSVEAPELPDSATLRERNGSKADVTYQDCWPSARYSGDGPPDNTPESAWAHMGSGVGATVREPVTVDQCEFCRAAPDQPHAPGCNLSSSPVISCDRKDDATACDCTAQVTDSVINAVETHPAWACFDCGQDRYGRLNTIVSTWHMGRCGICGETTAVTEPRDFGNRHGNRHDADPLMTFHGSGQFPGQATGTVEEKHLQNPAEMADKMADSFDVPFSVQSWTFEALCEVEIDNLHDLIDNHHARIIEMARDRFRKGFAEHGSTMYSWSPDRRLDETLQELADAVVYPTSGPVE